MLELLTLHADPLFLRREALRHGYSDKDLLQARRAGQVVHIRHGAYVDSGYWAAADPVERFRLRGQAVALRNGDSVMLSHTSAAAEHGLSLYDPDLSLVHVTRLDGQSGRVEAGVHHHTPTWSRDQVERRGEVLVADPATSAIGAALLTDVERGLVITDSFLHLRPEEEAALREAHDRVRSHPGARSLQIVLRLTRHGAQSPFETRCRFCMWCQHLPEPELQWHVYDNGVLIAIVDFAWPEHHLLGEADGQSKYGRLLGPNPTQEQISRALVGEKNREDLVREVTGFGMIRYVYGDLYVPDRLGSRTRTQLERYARLAFDRR